MPLEGFYSGWESQLEGKLEATRGFFFLVLNFLPSLQLLALEVLLAYKKYSSVPWRFFSDMQLQTKTEQVQSRAREDLVVVSGERHLGTSSLIFEDGHREKRAARYF